MHREVWVWPWSGQDLLDLRASRRDFGIIVSADRALLANPVTHFSWVDPDRQLGGKVLPDGRNTTINGHPLNQPVRRDAVDPDTSVPTAFVRRLRIPVTFEFNAKLFGEPIWEILPDDGFMDLLLLHERDEEHDSNVDFIAAWVRGWRRGGLGHGAASSQAGLGLSYIALPSRLLARHGLLDALSGCISHFGWSGCAVFTDAEFKISVLVSPFVVVKPEMLFKVLKTIS